MNKNLVTSLELSRELKELGVKQESEFYWSNCRVNAFGKYLFGKHQIITEKEMFLVKDYILYEKEITLYSAFLSGELGEMLSGNIDGDWLCISKTDDFWVVEYQNLGLIKKDKNLTEAMGKMLVYLIKNKLIEV